jgi:hypothetical protein
MTKFPHKPAAPSVRETIGTAIARSRGGLAQEERLATRQDVVRELIAQLDLPDVLKKRLRQSKQ